MEGERLRKQGEKGEGVKLLVDGMADRQVRAKGRHSAGLLGRPAAVASLSGRMGLKAPDLV